MNGFKVHSCSNMALILSGSAPCISKFKWILDPPFFYNVFSGKGGINKEIWTSMYAYEILFDHFSRMFDQPDLSNLKVICNDSTSFVKQNSTLKYCPTG